ncbi:DNA mismatch repair protein MutS [Clostridium tepidiprofundi DSM 19306]|uniref:DNA mismatch repair protein MutS n=1 Tax=Clostridium tepidiprofundi DSM 19306 TaxID=1121338 RepID=A0A151B3Y0_9CLOT|nr:methionine ABC transporter substrate-binding protein [Clostridium tepidiprofundi]KYH34615.1 DNA mismatch repair protein MutS [Clostridium tepidiprofundi DSM 19306]
MKFLENEQREQIGFSFVMEKTDVITAYGMKEKKDIKPFKITEKEKLLLEFESIQKMVESINKNKLLHKELERILMKFKDISNSIKRCKKHEILDEVELFEIKNFALRVEELLNVMNDIDLDIEEIKLYDLNEIVSLLDPEGKRISIFYIYDNYSDRLKNIRQQKKEIENKIFKETDEHTIERLKEERLNYVTLEEQEEIEIKKQLSISILESIDKIENDTKIIGRIDILNAKANLAIKYNAKKPKIVDNMYIKLVDAFNPEVVEILNKKKKKFTPVGIELRNGTTIITGANMGGKTVTLKTIVLNLLLSQCGFFVFAEEAVFPMLDFIYFISDDMQSISKGLSTFGAEIINLKQVVECIKRGNGFIALDEFARGTNPKEGYYIVKSLAEYLNKFDSISLISTHYDGIAKKGMDHYQVIGLKNLDFEALKHKIDLNKRHSVEIIQEHMNYKLEKVYDKYEVPKDALNISILLGLESEIVDIAKKYYYKEEKHEE